MGRPIEIAGRSFYEPKMRWKSGRAYIRFYDPNKRPKQKDYALHTADKQAADLLFQQRRFEYLNGLLDPWAQRRKDGVTLEEAVHQYLKAQDVRASTLKSKRVRLEPFTREHPGMLVSGITEDAVEAYCYQSRFKTSTQQRYLHEMRQFIEFCRKKGWITSNPAKDLQKSTPRRKKRQNRELTEYLRPSEVQRVISAIEQDIESNPRRAGRRVLIDVILFAVTTGLRRGEICNLKWSHIHLYDPPKQTSSGAKLYGWIGVRSEAGAQTKTGDEARVPIVPQVYELLKRMSERREQDVYVFTSPRKGSKLNAWWVSDRFRHYRRKAGIKEEIHFHSLRHTCASWLAEAGTDLKVIQEVLRHTSIRQTMRYAHLIPEVVSCKMIKAYHEIKL